MFVKPFDGDFKCCSWRMKAWFVLVFNSLYFLKEKCSCMLVQKIANTDLLQYMKSSREKSFAYYIIKICMPAASLVKVCGKTCLHKTSLNLKVFVTHKL